MGFGILQRYVMGQVLRTFLLALATITIIFSLFVVMAEATRQGLSPGEVIGVLPFLVPGSLPYTIPVALLFSVTIVYGRIAGDNEIIALKAAGLNALWVLVPAILLGLGLSVGLYVLSGEVIPRANNAFRRIIFGSVEEGLYRFLKKNHEFNNPNLPFYIQVQDVEGRTLIEPLFKHRVPGSPNTYDMVVRARRAEIDIDVVTLMATVTLEDAETSGAGPTGAIWLKDRRVLKYPIPSPPNAPDKRVQEMTLGEMADREQFALERAAHERPEQAAQTALRIATGRIDAVDWPAIREAHKNQVYWVRQVHELRTETHQRLALAAGAFFFVLVGAPVGILFAKRDFLSAFISCFVPILVVYYPLVLAGMNLGKEGVMPPWIVYAGDALLGVLAVFCIRPIHRH